MQAHGVLVYSTDLTARILAKEELPEGSEYEVEIRAWTVQAVEELKKVLREEHAIDAISIKIDWFLWEEGEKKDRAGALPPHHRTRTVFY